MKAAHKRNLEDAFLRTVHVLICTNGHCAWTGDKYHHVTRLQAAADKCGVCKKHYMDVRCPKGCTKVAFTKAKRIAMAAQFLAGK